MGVTLCKSYLKTVSETVHDLIMNSGAIYIYNILKKLCNFVLENLYHTVSYVHNQVNVLRNEYLKNNP